MYQTIRHTYYQKDSSTRSIEDVLNLLQARSVKVISLNLVKKDWTPKHYEVLEWHLVIWASSRISDDKLESILNKDT